MRQTKMLVGVSCHHMSDGKKALFLQRGSDGTLSYRQPRHMSTSTQVFQL